MKNSVIILLFLFSVNLSGQKPVSNVEFVGYKNQVLLAKKEAMKAPGKLSTGDVITVGCEEGKCFFRIEYKGRTIEQVVGDDITQLAIYEYDFGLDGDNEIVIVNDYKGTSYMFIYSYSRGIIQELFEKEIMNNKTTLKKEYIECNVPGGSDLIWNYYQGQFWKMTPYKNEESGGI
jgi:hypothetical protein